LKVEKNYKTVCFIDLFITFTAVITTACLRHKIEFCRY